MAAPELMTIDAQDVEQTSSDNLPTSLVYSLEYVDNQRAKFRGIAGQLTIEQVLVLEPVTEALEI